MLAVVLHAHLPWVRELEPWSPIERWLHEALWECYLPLLAVLDRLERGAITLSVSPTLASMFADPELRRRFESHLDEVRALNETQDTTAAAHYAAHLGAVADTWARIGGDVLAELRRLNDNGRVELLTTAATHAYLPGFGETAIDAQLATGRRSFEALSGVQPKGMWLPECGFDERIDRSLAKRDVAFSIVDEHAIRFANPAVDHAAVVSSNGVAYLARHREASHRVWSRDRGYPGNPVYREFYWELESDGPLGERTGLKYHAIDKTPYRPELAIAQASRDAADFKAWLRKQPGIVVAAYDCELFGHWWLEGVSFLESLLTLVGDDAVRASDAVGAGPLPVAQPSASSWGRGGFGEVWVGERTAPLWRHLHQTERIVRGAVMQDRDGDAAIDQAIRELLLMQASDWPFMIEGGALADYGERRFRSHRDRAIGLARGKLHADANDGFLRELDSETLRAAFQPSAQRR
jgi:1,4-alpha-glucan branching enzyme